MKIKTIHRWVFVLSLIVIVLILMIVNDYLSNEKCPAKIIEARFYQNEPEGRFYGAYINCEGNGIEYCEIIMEIIHEEGSEESNADVSTSSKSSDDLYVVRIIADEGGKLKECFNIPCFDKEEKIMCIKAFISKTVDCNGNVWRATTEDKANVTTAFLNEAVLKEKPIHLCEASLISYHNRITGEKENGIKNLYVSWENTSDDVGILNVFYKLYGVNQAGEIARIEGRTCETVYSMNKSPENNNAIRPGEENSERQSYVSESDVEWMEYTEHTFLAINRVITTDGRVWYNKNDDDAIELVLDGKKGYSFSTKYKTEEINQLIEILKKKFEQEGMTYLSDQPEIALRDKQYLVLRYPQIDILVGLNIENRFSGDRVGIAYYETLRDEASIELIEDINNRCKVFRSIIMPVALTAMPYDYVSQCVEAYNTNEEEEIDFGDDSYRTQIKAGKIYGADNEQIIMITELVGKNLSEDAIYSLIQVLPSA